MDLYDIPIDAPATWAATGVPADLKPQRATFEEIEHRFPSGGYTKPRDAWITRYGFAVPTAAVIAELASVRLLEIGAGGGWWASLIAGAGGDIVATDEASPDRGNRYGQRIATHHPVERLTAVEAVTKYPDRDLLMIWPCRAKRWSLNAVRELAPGRTVYHVGELGHGCTGTPALAAYLEKNFEGAEYRAIPNWNSINDILTIHRNKAEGAEA